MRRSARGGRLHVHACFFALRCYPVMFLDMSTSLCAAVASSRAVAGQAPCRRQALAAWLPQPRLVTRANERSVTASAAETAEAAAGDQALAGRPAGRGVLAKPQFDDAEFETMLQQLREWKEKHWGDTIVPRKVTAASGPPLPPLPPSLQRLLLLSS